MEQRPITTYFSRAHNGTPIAALEPRLETTRDALTVLENDSSDEQPCWPVACSAYSRSTISMLDFLVKRGESAGPSPRPAKRSRPTQFVRGPAQKKITQFGLAPSRLPDQPCRLSKYLLHRIMTFLLLRENARIGACCRFFRSAFRFLWTVPDYFDSFSTDWMSPAELEYLRRKLRTVHLELLDKLLSGRVAKSFLERNSIQIAAHAAPGAVRREVREFTARPQARLNRAVNLLDRDLEALSASSRHTLYLLELRKCVYISARGFELLPNFRKLRTLRLAAMDLPESVFLSIIENCRFLSELTLVQCPKLTSQSLSRLLCDCTWLMQLDISSSPSMFTDFCDFNLFAKPKLLESLNLTGIQLPIAALRQIVSAAVGLRRLALGQYSPFDLEELHRVRPSILTIESQT